MKNSTLAIIITTVLSFSTGNIKAQIKALKVGEKLPVKIANHTFNYPMKEFHFEKAKGKILILDFWSTWCGACISGLRNLNILQKKFGDKLMIVPVNYQSRQIVEKFWPNNPITKDLSLMTITDDKTLSTLFPHFGLPFEVWFDQNGIYLGSTNLEWANEKEVRKILNGDRPDWVPVIKQNDHNFTKTIIPSTSSDYSLLLKNSSNERPGEQIIIDEADSALRITCINYNILGLYNVSLNDHPELKDLKRFKINVRDTTRLRYYKSAGYFSLWNKLNTYCYELKFSGISLRKSSAFEKMRTDLDYYFDYKSEIKKIKTKCYRLVKMDKSDGWESNDIPKDKKSLSTVIGYLNSIKNFPIVIGDLKNADMEKIKFEFNANEDFYSANNKLKPNGYCLIPDEQDLNYFILTDR